MHVQDHGGGVLDVLLHEVGEPGHGGTVNHSVVGRPAHIHDMCFNQVVLIVKSWYFSYPTDGSYGNLKNIN